MEQGTVRRIAALAAPGPGDVVLEVGPGLGSLTLALLEAGAGQVVAVEIDRVLAGELPRTLAERAPALAGRVTVINADALRTGQDDLPAAPSMLVANLPYNVAVPVVLHLLAAVPALARGLVMVQAEVADRMCAPPGSRVYGAPSVKLAWYATARPAGTVPRSVFWPVPNVDSRLVAFTRHDPPATAASREEVFALVDAAFAQRRKTLRAALAGWAGSAPEAERLLRAAGIDPGARGESLGVAEFARLAAARTTSARRTAYDLIIVTGVTARVPAKLNLQLAVGPPRADGYHDLVTVFHAVSLFDQVTVEPAGRDGITVTGEGADRVPADQDNLALRAIAALRAAVRDRGTARRARHHRQADPGGRRAGGWQRRRGGRPGRLQRAVGHRPDPAAAVRDRRHGRQRRGLRAARRDRGRPRPRRAADPRAGPGHAVPLGAGLRRRPAVHARGLRRPGPAARRPARRSGGVRGLRPQPNRIWTPR